MRTVLIVLALVVLGLAALFYLGPRPQVGDTVTFDAAAIGDDPEAYLAAREAEVANLKEGAQKRIVWADPAAKAKTPLAVVYVHGFSATTEEVRPLPDIVAKELGANLHFARLTGHGRDGAGMADGSADAWLDDVAEAIAIGRRIGDRVILLSASTGGTLTTWAAQLPGMMENVAGQAMISPNFAVVDPNAALLTLPWGRQLLPAVVGAQRSFEAMNEEHGRWWTTSYPTVALIPMQATVERAAKVPVEDIAVPALFIFHPDDKVVRSDVTEQVAARWGKNTGAKVEIERVTQAEDPFNHVIAGRILSPSNTEPLAARIVEWARGL